MSGAMLGRKNFISPGAVLMLIGAILVALFATRNAIVFATAARYPELATRLAPSNATAIVHVFDKAVRAGDSLQRDPKGWVAASTKALQTDPMNAGGIRLLAYVTELTPNGQTRARRLMQLSERTSKRDALAQLWLLEDAVQRGDVAGALSHYDRLLTVHPEDSKQLIPVLAAAAQEQSIQAALVPYLRANRTWVPEFLSTAVAQSPDPIAIVNLFRRYGGARVVPGHAELETSMLKRLVSVGNMDAARGFALTTGAGAAIDRIAFSPATTNIRFAPLTWSLYDGPDGQVALDAENALRISVRPETKIVVASRIIARRAGRVFLTQHFSYPERDAVPLVVWRAYCRHLAGPEQFWVRDFPPRDKPIAFRVPIDVPDRCDGLQIDLEVTGAQDSSDSKLVVDRVELTAS